MEQYCIPKSVFENCRYNSTLRLCSFPEDFETINNELNVCRDVGYYLIYQHLMQSCLKFVILKSKTEASFKGKKGRWTGLLGQIQRNECDLAFHRHYMSPDRVKVSEFLYPVDQCSAAYIIGRKFFASKKKLEIFAIFDNEVWLLFLAAFCLSYFLCLSLSRIENYFRKEPDFMRKSAKYKENCATKFVKQKNFSFEGISKQKNISFERNSK